MSRMAGQMIEKDLEPDFIRKSTLEFAPKIGHNGIYSILPLQVGSGCIDP